LSEQARQDVNAGLAQLQPQPSPYTEIQYIQAYAAAFRVETEAQERLVRELSSITPPSELTDAHKSFVEAGKDLSAYLQRASEYLAGVQSLDDLSKKPPVTSDPYPAAESACSEVQRVINQGAQSVNLHCKFAGFFPTGGYSNCDQLPTETANACNQALEGNSH